MFEALHEIQNDRVHRYAVMRGGAPISYAEVLELWQYDTDFRAFFITLLSESPFSAFQAFYPAWRFLPA